MSCGWGSGSQNHHGASGAYLSGCNDGDMALGGGYECLEMALAGHGDHWGGWLTHLGSGGCVLLTFMLSRAGVGI